ncbi:hypothetical protein F7734_25510 [Scytonema sp. UIC 10036]|uniref:hypothetical protein n=1 Tax=Scytonema sp. UIC 10036 TaxID=2304196 RepID=UPI0012DAE189|nr:hypothetical protein [Scytonema sp. UIC 10036]MUG95536.1 hypothetical protein [Scytonema sp. UIC 10036]
MRLMKRSLLPQQVADTFSKIKVLPKQVSIKEIIWNGNAEYKLPGVDNQEFFGKSD